MFKGVKDAAPCVVVKKNVPAVVSLKDQMNSLLLFDHVIGRGLSGVAYVHTDSTNMVRFSSKVSTNNDKEVKVIQAVSKVAEQGIFPIFPLCIWSWSVLVPVLGIFV